MLCGISTFVFLVINSGGVFWPSGYGNASFFPAVQTRCKFGKFIKIKGNLQNLWF